MLDGILFHLYQRRMKKKVKEEDTIRQLAVPTKLRHEIRKTYESIRQNISGLVCTKIFTNILPHAKLVRLQRETHTMHPLPIHDVFSSWHMDILAGLPKTKEGYQYILLMIDSFSHWCECVPLQSQDAANVAKVFYNEIFTRYGLPSSILSDQGQIF